MFENSYSDFTIDNGLKLMMFKAALQSSHAQKKG